MEPASRASTGIASRTTSDSYTCEWVEAAPILSTSPSRTIPFISGMLVRSTRSVGAASRCFSVGSRVWPPERKVASTPSANMALASARDAGRR